MESLNNGNGFLLDQSGMVPVNENCIRQVYIKDSQSKRSLFGPLKVLELPEMIFVETRFIAQQAVNQINTDSLCSFNTIVKAEHNRPQGINHTIPILHLANTCTTPSVQQITQKDITSTPTLKLSTDASVQATTKQNNAGTLTDGPNPVRDRGQQTEAPEKILTASIGIQCNFEDSDYLIFEENTHDTQSDDNDNDNDRFLQFAKENVAKYHNGKEECRICGEVQRNSKAMLRHLAMHWGPPALCSRCGIQFENVKQLSSHPCEMRRRKKKQKSTRHKIYRCPHYFCQITAISLLELYDHINEHTGDCCYHCSGCKQNFKTAGEMRGHLPLHLQCLEKANNQILPYPNLKYKRDRIYRKRVLTVHSTKQKNVLIKLRLGHNRYAHYRRVKTCHICLRKFRDLLKFKYHHKMCINNYVARWRKKRSLMKSENVKVFGIANFK